MRVCMTPREVASWPVSPLLAQRGLIEKLWDSLVEERGDQLEVTPEIRAELDRRSAAHRRAPDATLSWAEVKRQVRGLG